MPTFVGKSPEAGVLTASAGELLLVNSAHPAGAQLYVPLRLTLGDVTVTTGVTRGTAPLAFAGPVTVEVMEPALLLPRRVALTGGNSATIVLTEGEKQTLTVAPGEVVRLFGATAALDPVSGGPTLLQARFRQDASGTFTDFGNVIIGEGQTFVGPLEIEFSLPPKDNLTGTDAATVTYLRATALVELAGATTIAVSTGEVVAVIEGSADLETWQPVALAALPDDPAVRFLRLRIQN